MTHPAGKHDVLSLRVGDLVEIRSAEEILATLDERGELENLPFMPEMLAFCGRRLTVHKVANKLCDTITGTGNRRMTDSVHLTGARCDGSAHGGCQTACSLYWKERWLKRVEPGDAPKDAPEGRRVPLPLLMTNTHREPGPDGEERFSCQATELLRAAPACLRIRQVGQYVSDVRSGNVGVLTSLRSFLVVAFNAIQDRSRAKLPRWLRIRGGLRWRFLKGSVVGRTPTVELNLRPGELVRIKTKEQILSTVDERLNNRGLGFDEEMARYCGRTATVRARVDRCIDEKTGRMLHMKSSCIILDDIVCAGVYHASCPREFLPFWREIWLERVGMPSGGS